MDTGLKVLMQQDTPHLNPDLANGLAVKHMREAEAYVDSVFRAVARGFPQGLTYLGGRRCTPEEEYNEITKRRGSRRVFDVARSDIYLMEYSFKFNGEVLKRYIFLPFVSDGGVIFLSGSRFIVSPVLADRVISITDKNIFMRLGRAKVTFERESQTYQANFEKVPGRPAWHMETVQVAWSLIYNRNPKYLDVKPEIQAHTTLVHYLFCKFGFEETFKTFGGFVPVVGNHETITEEKYPSSEWVICKTATTSKMKPKTYRRKLYTPTNIRLAVRKEQYTAMAKNLICGFFYVVDHFPNRILPDPAYLESTRLWRTLMGHILFSSNISEGKLADDVNDHIGSLDQYIDEVTRAKFSEINIPIDNLYQLFGIVIENFNEWLLGAADRINSMYDKELSVLYYVLYDVTSQINNFYFKLTAASKKELTVKDIENIMQSTLKQGAIFALNKKHGEVSTIASAGDNKAIKLTAILIPQASTSKTAGRKEGGAMTDPSKHLHVSVAEIGQYSNLPKSEPSGRSRLNQMVRTDARGMVLRNPELAELLDNVQDMIRR